MPARGLRLAFLAIASLHFTVLPAVIGGCGAAFVGDDPKARRSVASEWVDDAFKELRAGNIDSAMSLLKNAVELSPEYGEARDALGILLMAQGRLDDAIIQFKWATGHEPDVAHFHFHLAMAYIAQGSIGFATPALNRALELSPEMEDAKRTLLDAYMLLGRWDRAERLHAELLQRMGEEDPRLQYSGALIDFAREDLPKAQKKFHQIAADDREDPASPAAMGLIYEVQGFYDDAEKWYREALKRAPEDPYLHLVMADLYQKIGQYGSAERHLRRVLIRQQTGIQIPPSEIARTYFQIAEIGYQTGKYRTSELYKRRAVELLPALKNTEITIDSAAHFALGVIELERENVDAAIREFKVAIKGNLKFVLAWSRLAEALLLKAGLSAIEERLEHLNLARKSAEKAQELAPRYAMGYYLEGKILTAMADLQEDTFRAGTLREAVFAFQQAKNADRPPPDINVFQAAILSDLESHDKAAETLAEAMKLIPGRFDIAFLRATELVKAEKFKEARAALTEAWALDNDHPDLGPTMSIVLFKLGDVVGAQRALDWQPGQGQLPGLLDISSQQTTSRKPATADQ